MRISPVFIAIVIATILAVNANIKKNDPSATTNRIQIVEPDEGMQQIPNVAESLRTIEVLREVAAEMRARGQAGAE